MYNFQTCKNTVLAIIDGNTTLGSITNETINDYLWHGPVQGLHSNFPRADYLAVTYHGCVKICGGDKIALNDTAKALNIAANWIFPLAILFNLPYDSLHRAKVRGTLEAISNWLGSPQTALTATIFNFRQIRQCHRRVKEVNGDMQGVASNAFYILSCMNQFQLRCASQDDHKRMLQVLVYGLFRPLSGQANSDDVHDNRDVLLLRQLLSMMAHQLRMLRRRGVIPTLSSLAIFLVAFIFSVVLAFGELGDNSTAHSLGLGLLVSWLPLLVVFTIVDRNPISAERSAELMSRWLYNVDAIRTWHANEPQSHSKPNIVWWRTENAGFEPFQIGDFIGQGRRMEYTGLTSAVVKETEDSRRSFNRNISSFDQAADDIHKRLQTKAFSWWIVAIISLFLVLFEIMMAFMVAFTTPTVGLGCRSFAYLLVAIISSLSWVLNLFIIRPPRWVRITSHICNAGAILLLTATIGFQLTGALNNCWCKGSLINTPLLGGYIDFENAPFYRANFDVTRYWALGTTFGGLVPLLAFIVAVFWWLKCQHLWSANDRTRAYQMSSLHVNTQWLR